MPVVRAVRKPVELVEPVPSLIVVGAKGMVRKEEEIRELREVVTNLQWALVETLRCCELMGQDASVDANVLERIEKAGHAVKHLKPSPPLNQ